MALARSVGADSPIAAHIGGQISDHQTFSSSGSKITAPLIKPRVFVSEVPMGANEVISFIAQVYSATKQTGQLAIDRSVFQVSEDSGYLVIHGFGKELLRTKDYRSIAGSGEQAQIQISMTELKTALDNAHAAVEDAEIGEELDGTKAVGVIDLAGLNPDVSGFDEVVIPLLIEELKLAHHRSWGKNSKFLLKGDPTLIARVSAQIPSGQVFIVTSEEELGKEYTDAKRILITSPGNLTVQGMRHFFIQSPQAGDLPNFRGMLRASLSLARVEDLKSTDPRFLDVLNFVGLLVGHEISDLEEYIRVTENPGAVAIEKIQELYALPAITRLAINQILQGARLAIRMSRQSA